MDNAAEPLFRQVAGLIEDSIIDGSLAPGDRVPSTNELASFHGINPATARKGLSLLVDDQIVEKRRGIGMFVTPNARDLILEKRRQEFVAHYLAPLIDEASRLGFSRQRLHDLLNHTAESRGMN